MLLIQHIKKFLFVSKRRADHSVLKSYAPRQYILLCILYSSTGS
jgi:hypothetical protein